MGLIASHFIRDGRGEAAEQIIKSDWQGYCKFATFRGALIFMITKGINLLGDNDPARHESMSFTTNKFA